jgi:hypothetical protein
MNCPNHNCRRIMESIATSAANPRYRCPGCAYICGEDGKPGTPILDSLRSIYGGGKRFETSMNPITSELEQTTLDDVELAFRYATRHAEYVLQELEPYHARRLAARLIMRIAHQIARSDTGRDELQALVDRMVGYCCNGS